ncbi:MAG: protein-tyrosine-phosphatase [Bacteroidetes bacterium RIFCSPHIGHO2_02_FULL_44_7]|nr:MAG: protein-tyrosine-phosphatase [Bacteroidetes bacterium RIFCSPHIGHO2_02_FULL_44_7]
MFANIQQVIDKMDFNSISENRKAELEVLTQFIQEKKDKNLPVLLNFICTHNSRRSQFSQVWSQVASDYYRIPAQSYSGGVEETAVNERAVASLERFGFKVTKNGEDNPKYQVQWNVNSEPLVLFSKMYDDSINPSSDFAAIMTCSHADENCPFVAGCEKRIPIRYEDPKNFDDTPLESALYDYRSFEIATELFYIFSKIS